MQDTNNNNMENTSEDRHSFQFMLNWSSNDEKEQPVDLDLSCFLLTEKHLVRTNDDFVFYNQLCPIGECIEHQGDSIGNDDISNTNSINGEKILIRYNKLPPEIVEIAFAVSTYDYHPQAQNFGMLQSGVILISAGGKPPINCCNLKDYSEDCVAVVFGKIVKIEKIWKYYKIGKAYNNGLREIALNYGVDLE